MSIIEWPPTRDVQTNGKTASACSSCEDDKEERVLSDEQYDRSVASTERKTSERVEHQRQRDDESEKQKAEQEAAKQVQKTVATESKSPKFNSTTPAKKQKTKVSVMLLCPPACQTYTVAAALQKVKVAVAPTITIATLMNTLANKQTFKRPKVAPNDDSFAQSTAAMLEIGKAGNHHCNQSLAPCHG